MIQFELTTIYNPTTIYVLLASWYVFWMAWNKSAVEIIDFHFFFPFVIKSIYILSDIKKSYQLCLYHLKMKSCLYRLSLESIDINDAICTFSKLFWNGKTFHGLNFFEEKLDRERVCDDNFITSWKFNIETFEKCWKWGWNGTQTRQLGDKSMWWSEEIVA